MQYKKIVPCIYLKKGIAVKGLKNDEMVSEDPIALAKDYSNNGADEIIVFDFSNSDEEHEAALGIIKEIGREIDIPMIGAGNVKRMEDEEAYLCRM